MTAMTRLRRQAILKQASGYIELGELLVEADRPLPASAANAPSCASPTRSLRWPPHRWKVSATRG
jgi:hypothetical protein